MGIGGTITCIGKYPKVDALDSIYEWMKEK